MLATRSYIIVILLTFASALAMPVFAEDLCDQSCQLTIDFPDGGDITAVEPLIITFGNDAVVDNGATADTYSAGETISLLAGETLDFGIGGAFDIGDGGNINYTDMIINGGALELAVTGGSETVHVYALTINVASMNFASGTILVGDGGQLTFNVENDVTLLSGSNLINNGSLTVSSGTLNLNSFVWDGGSGNTEWTEPDNWQGGVVPSSGHGVVVGSLNVELNVSLPPVETLTLGASNGLTLGSNSNVITNVDLQNLNNNLVIEGGVFSPDGGLTIDGGIITADPLALTDGVWSLSDGVMTLSSSQGFAQPVTMMLSDFSEEDFEDLFVGAKFATPDGDTCTMEEDACVTATGAKYVLQDGGLVLEEEGGSLVSLFSSLLFCMLIAVGRRCSA